jgi:glycosyltransferase involved in cell wall biosynthesis
MRVIVALETRLSRTPDERIWSTSWSEYSFWLRYLEVFAEVCVLARVHDVPAAPPNAHPADGPGVHISAVPYFVGPWQYLHRGLAVRRTVQATLHSGDAAILRIPGTIATSLWGALQARRQPYAAEVVGDPYDVFAPGASHSYLRPFWRWHFTRHLRRQCAGAAAAAYVTEQFLQTRYPPAANAYATGCSDIDLLDDAFAAAPHTPPRDGRRLEVVFVGTLQQLYKRPDVLVEAVAAVVRSGLDVGLTFVGDGQHRAALEQRSRQLGIGERVRFAGQLPGVRAVRAELDRADLFVLPSRQEGLPRALVEAMARGLPCVASTVGGIPELLPLEVLVPPGDVDALAARMRAVLTHPKQMTELAARNLARAHDFHANRLRTRRRAFYEAVRERTLEWQRRADRR